MTDCNNNYCVYIHTNNINGKKYVGQTCQDPKYRWRSDGSGYKPRKNNTCRFWNAIQKYGWDNFTHEVLYENLSLEQANTIEAELIEKYNTTNDDFGYNIRPGGDNSTLSEETRQKIRMARLGNNYGMIGEKAPMYGKHHTEEAKRKIGDAFKGEKHPFYGTHWSEEMKQHHRKLLGKKIICVETGIVYEAIREAARITEINRCCIAAVLHGKQKTAGGYHWEYYIDIEETKAA